MVCFLLVFNLSLFNIFFIIFIQNRKGGWWELTSFLDLTGPICIEILPRCYLKAMDNGLFKVGEMHELNDAPDQEEVFTCIRSNDTQISLKSGYNKFLAIDSKNRLIGRSDAIGDRELFEPVFEAIDDCLKLAILASNKNFLSYDEDENTIFAVGRKVQQNEIFKIRSNVDPIQVKFEKKQSEIPEEERGTLDNCEEKYLKKFQSKPDFKSIKKDNLNLKKAKNEGSLHELLLDRRSKLKSDKFC